ncbi:MAG: SAM-dependent chlorinase/fluorinase [Polyangiaceae bacterium]
MKPSGVVTLLTDFGLRDPFVGVMHGVILGRFPQARIVDLSHGVEAQCVDEAAFWLERCFSYFPPGTVHVAVVDPEVGTARQALVLASQGHVFVAPDNGLVSRLASLPDAEAFAVDIESVGLGVPSRTFHGRDVFAPLGAELASGRLSPSAVGPRAMVRPLSTPLVAVESGELEGRVVSVDHFGNLITDIGRERLRSFARPVLEIQGNEIPFAGTYAEVPEHEALALVSSFDSVEIAVRGGNAATRFGVHRGCPVRIREARPRSK